MEDEEDVIEYYQRFHTLSKPLLKSQRLTTGQRNEAFWRGFHSMDRAEMYDRLRAELPHQPAGVCFDYLDVYRVARMIFSDYDLYERPHSPSTIDHTPHHSHHQRSNTRPSEIKTNAIAAVRFTEPALEEEDQSYAVPNAECARRFPNAPPNLPKPSSLSM
jgi:hypothetical protein